MRRLVAWFWVAIVLFAVVAVSSSALAQGVTGAAVTGVVTGENAGPLETAQVQLRNTSTGEVFSATAGEGGRYFIDNVPPGGPYTLTVAFTGFPLTTQQGIRLSLGQRLQLDVEMKLAVEEVTVIEHIDPLQDHARTGATTSVGQEHLEGIPLQGRNFTDLFTLAPQVTGVAGSGGSIGGQNNRYNNIQIDGGANHDLFGLAASGTPGGQSNAKPLTIEAISQFVIQVAPFDVRQGNFVGGLINAITKSGTNDFHGGVFTYFQNKDLAGKQDDPTFLDYHAFQFGGSLGGPIIRDKLHFFVAFDLQDRSQSFGNQFQIGGVDDTADLRRAGFTNATAQRFVDILRDKYGVTGVGDALAPSLSNPDRNVFGKLTWTIDDHNRLEASYNFVDASQDVLSRTVSATSPTLNLGGLQGGYQLSNSGYTQSNNTNTLRLKLTSNWGNVSNEAIASLSFIRDSRDIPNQLPLIMVKVGNVGAASSWLAAGGERFSQANSLDQNIYEIQDNLSFNVADKHRLTVGTSNEFLHIKNLFLQASLGAWAFNSLDDLDNGVPAAFQRRFGIGVDDPGLAEFDVSQFGFYVQDEWTPFKRLTLTPGVRIDIPILSSAHRNDALAANSTFPIDTSDVPSGNVLFSPRLGFNYDVEGNSDTIVRGGAGIFTGRPPYVWVSNAYALNGTQTELVCNAMSGVPAFTADPRNQPSNCTGGMGVANPAPEIDYFDPGTKYPQNFQAALGLDKRLPFGLIGTVDILYSHDVNGWYTNDENLVDQGTSGEGRELYGTFAANGRATPSRVDTKNLAQAIKVYNKSGSQAFSATAQLSKQISRFVDVSLAYTYSKSTDLISLTSSQALSNWRFAPLDGTLAERNARPSAFDRTHKITLTGTARLPYGFSLGASYVGQSGLPYTWIVNGDVNGDGAVNDAVFVPASPSQITLADSSQWDTLNNFINGQECLRNARGRLIERGECRNPWSQFLNVRLAWGWNFVKDQKFEVQLDIFNFLNLLNSDWGKVDSAANFETANASFLTPVGYDMTNNRPIYNVVIPSTVTATVYTPTQSRWRIQLGARYDF